MTEFKKRWEVIREIGRGGQGRVFLVRDKNKFNKDLILDDLKKSIARLNSGQTPEGYSEGFEKFSSAIKAIQNSESADVLGALKVFDSPQNDQDLKVLQARMLREIEVLKSTNHSHILKIIDNDPDGGWFVSIYFPLGTLSEENSTFKGDLLETLNAVRPLVECMADLHQRGTVHRDIKPKNIFLESKNCLILGDFGIVYFQDDRTRLSQTFMGSSNWVAPWINHIMVENIPPSADVFSFGKVIWSMVSGLSVLPYWYYDQEPYDVAKLFPKESHISLANELFSQCIVERENQCLRDASQLLAEIDRILHSIKQGPLFLTSSNPKCRICLGNYKVYSDRDRVKVQRYGLGGDAEGDHKIYVCEKCGHVEMFYFLDNLQKQTWWQRIKQSLLLRVGKSFKIRPKIRVLRDDGRLDAFEDSIWQLERNDQEFSLRNTSTNHVLMLSPNNFGGFRIAQTPDSVETIILSKNFVIEKNAIAEAPIHKADFRD